MSWRADLILVSALAYGLGMAGHLWQIGQRPVARQTRSIRRWLRWTGCASSVTVALMLSQLYFPHGSTAGENLRLVGAVCFAGTSLLSVGLTGSLRYAQRTGLDTPRSW